MHSSNWQGTVALIEVLCQSVAGFVAARWMVESPYPARARQSGEEGGLPVGLR